MHTATGRKTPASTVRAAARRSSIGAALCGTCGRETHTVFHEGSAGEPARWRARTLPSGRARPCLESMESRHISGERWPKHAGRARSNTAIPAEESVRGRARAGRWHALAIPPRSVVVWPLCAILSQTWERPARPGNRVPYMDALAVPGNRLQTLALFLMPGQLLRSTNTF